ncbi:MAG: carbon storage regulator [Pirellulales bacterium]|nr:carbon storage regulator [Pirellulales bacterium]
MLVLTRKVGQGINVGSGIAFKLLGSRNGQARIGVTAPEGVKILRDELQDRRERTLGERRRNGVTKPQEA